MGQLLFILSGCAVTLHDHTFCSPIPGGYGAACDNFLTSNPQTLSQADWEALQLSWQAKGWALEVTESDAVGNLKKELEELCSKTACNYDTQQSVDGLVHVLAKMQDVATHAKSLR